MALLTSSFLPFCKIAADHHRCFSGKALKNAPPLPPEIAGVPHKGRERRVFTSVLNISLKQGELNKENSLVLLPEVPAILAGSRWGTAHASIFLFLPLLLQPPQPPVTWRPPASLCEETSEHMSFTESYNQEHPWVISCWERMTPQVELRLQ